MLSRVNIRDSRLSEDMGGSFSLAIAHNGEEIQRGEVGTRRAKAVEQSHRREAAKNWSKLVQRILGVVGKVSVWRSGCRPGR